MARSGTHPASGGLRVGLWARLAMFAMVCFILGHIVMFGLTRSLDEAVILTPATASGRASRVESGNVATAVPRVLKVMSYNLNHVSRGNDNSPDNDPHFPRGASEATKIAMSLNCLARDPGRVTRNLQQMADLIRSEDPDILFLQEVDRDAVESRRIDVVRWLAQATGFTYVVFGPKWSMDLGVVRHVTGNAILSKYPILEAENVPLNQLTLLRRLVGIHTALAATIAFGEGRIRLINTHLYSKKHGYEKKAMQVKRLLRLVEESPDPVIWGGDLNSSFGRLRRRRPASHDPTLALVCDSGLAQTSGFFDERTLDYIFLRPGDGTRNLGLRRIDPVATDHHIVVGLVQIPVAAARAMPDLPETQAPSVPAVLNMSEVVALVWR